MFVVILISVIIYDLKQNVTKCDKIKRRHGEPTSGAHNDSAQPTEFVLGVTYI